MNQYTRKIKFLMILLFLTSCSWISSIPGRLGKTQSTYTPTANCPSLPKNFKETDLIGKWIAEYTEDTDTLILREDGKYKQIYDNPRAGFYYESDWLSWWIEYRDVGYLWLHMEGMRRCDDLPEVCKQEGGGTERRTIDSCENIDVPEKGQVVLIVTGADFETQRGIVLRQTRLTGREWSYFFVFHEENEMP